MLFCFFKIIIIIIIIDWFTHLIYYSHSTIKIKHDCKPTDNRIKAIYPTTCHSQGGIAPNQVIARSEFEVHREIYT